MQIDIMRHMLGNRTSSGAHFRAHERTWEMTGNFIDKKCPRCGSSLLSDGTKEWCSFVGGGMEKPCSFGISDMLKQDDLRRVDGIDVHNVIED